MAQPQAQTDTRILLIDGFQLPGLLTMSEGGVEQSEIEVPESGFIRLIGSGIDKIPVIEVEYLTKRDGIVHQYFNDWRKAQDDRDVNVYFCDKTQRIENAYRRDTYSGCELGNYRSPAFDNAAREFAKLMLSLFPYGYDDVVGL